MGYRLHRRRCRRVSGLEELFRSSIHVAPGVRRGVSRGWAARGSGVGMGIVWWWGELSNIRPRGYISDALQNHSVRPGGL